MSHQNSIEEVGTMPDKTKARKTAAQKKPEKKPKTKRELSAEELDKVSGGGIPDPKHHTQR